MHKNYKTYYLIIFISILWIAGCKKPESFPIEPAITELTFSRSPEEKVLLSFRFTDGDGDLGLNAEDTLSPFGCQPNANGNCENKYYNNILINQYNKENDVWVKQNIELNGRFLRIETTGKNKALNGEIDFDMSDIFPGNLAVNLGDTIKYEIQIIDRTLHESNILETNDIILTP